MLQRQVEVRREPAAARGDERDDLGRAVHRLERADAERDVGVDRVERAQQRQQRATAASGRGRTNPRCTPVSVISLKPAAATRATSRTTPSDRQAAAGAARRRDDAVGAPLFAAGLRADRERRPPGDAGLDRRRRTARRRRRIARRQSSLRRCRVLVVVADDADDAGKRRDFVRPARGVAAGRDDLRRRDSRARCGGSSAARPGRPSRSPSRC